MVLRTFWHANELVKHLLILLRPEAYLPRSQRLTIQSSWTTGIQ